MPGAKEPTPPPQSLAGVRVLDLSRVLAGPWCTQTLADLGADVIKVERPRSGDDTRGWGPPFLKDRDGVDTGEAAYYLGTNRNKRSITVRYRFTRRAGAGARDWPGSADVLVENFKVGDLARYGLDAAHSARARIRGSCTARSPASARPARTASAPATTTRCRAWAG